MSSLLSVSHLHWSVANKTILNDISFTLNKGEVIGVIGPNGAGKTSLLRAILNQQSGIEGEIHFKGKSIQHYTAKQLAQHFAVVAQKAVPIFDLTVFDVVRMGLLPNKSIFSLDNDHDRRQISLSLEKVGLSAHEKSQYKVLSGGEQQRVLIARALVQGAEILILDEPTNRLDVDYQHQILHLVKNLNITVIMTVHDLNLAAQFCQRLILLNQGTLVCDDVPDKVLSPKIMSEVFRLDCHLEPALVAGAPRIYFSLPEQSPLKGDN